MVKNNPFAAMVSIKKSELTLVIAELEGFCVEITKLDDFL